LIGYFITAYKLIKFLNSIFMKKYFLHKLIGTLMLLLFLTFTFKVKAQVTLSSSPPSLSPFTSFVGGQSFVGSIAVNGNNLVGDVTITAPNFFKVSLNQNFGYATTVAVSPGSFPFCGQTNVCVTVYVIYTPVSVGTNSGTIIVSTLARSTGTATISSNVSVSGTATADWLANGLNMYNANPGNIGIGVTFPQYKLDVAGTGNFTGFKLGTTSTYGNVLTADSTGLGTWKPLFGGQMSMQNGMLTFSSDVRVAGKLHVGNSSLVLDGNATGSATGDEIYNDGQTPGQFDLILQSNALNPSGNTILNANGNTGSVGIGTLTPSSSYKLDVNGSGNFTGLNVSGTGSFNGFKLGTTSTAGQVLTSDNTGTGTWVNLPTPATQFWSGSLTGDVNNLNTGNVRLGPIPSKQPGQPPSRLSVYNSYNNQHVFVAPVAYLQANDDFYGTYYNMSLLKMSPPGFSNNILEANYFDGANTNELISISTTGQTVIGNANSTGTMLDVKGTGSFKGLIMPTGADNGKILISDANGKASWGTAPSGLVPFFTAGTNNFVTPHATSYNTTSGLIGLGTSNPQSFVHMVGGDLRIDEDPNLGNDVNKDGTNEPGADIYLFDKNKKGLSLTAQSGVGVLTTMDASMTLILGAGRFGQAMYITPENIVSIGAGMPTTGTAAGYNLYVKNGILTEKLKIALPTDAANWVWPDFVFRKGYKLASLKEVESFINKNHHLAGVPSESEVKANGIDVAQMDAALLKKIEELTLYMIEMKKEVDALKEENQEMKKQIRK
jgi:trimeric autotransporter adhesin